MLKITILSYATVFFRNDKIEDKKVRCVLLHVIHKGYVHFNNDNFPRFLLLSVNKNNCSIVLSPLFRCNTFTFKEILPLIV